MVFDRLRQFHLSSDEKRRIKSIPPVGQHERIHFDKTRDRLRATMMLAPLLALGGFVTYKVFIEEDSSGTGEFPTSPLGVPFTPGQFGEVTTQHGVCYLPNMIGDAAQTEVLLDFLADEGYDNREFDGVLDGLRDGVAIIYDDSVKLPVKNLQAKGASEGIYPGNPNAIDGLAAPLTCRIMGEPYFIPHE